MLMTILVILVILMLLGYGGHVYNPGIFGNSPYLGNGLGGIGLILIIVLIVVLVR